MRCMSVCMYVYIQRRQALPMQSNCAAYSHPISHIFFFSLRNDGLDFPEIFIEGEHYRQLTQFLIRGFFILQRYTSFLPRLFVQVGK